MCMLLLVILTGWDIIYIYYAWNLKVPVPRALDQINNQNQTRDAVTNQWQI